jgi:tryptophan halogenase
MDRAGDAAGQPLIQRLMRGRPREFWVRNCLLMPGEALDPLESTGLHLAQTGITRWLAHFPVRIDSPTDRAEYNRLTGDEYDRIRDLLALHYCARGESPFRQRRGAAELPATLAQRLALFADSARLNIGEEEHCGVDGWLAVLLGQGVQPRAYDPLADCTPLAHARDALAHLASEMRACAAAAPGHQAFLAQRGATAPTSVRDNP